MLTEIEQEMEDLVADGYLLRKGVDEDTGELLYGLNYMKHPDATLEDENDVITLKLPGGIFERGLRIFLKDGFEEA